MRYPFEWKELVLHHLLLVPDLADHRVLMKKNGFFKKMSKYCFLVLSYSLSPHLAPLHVPLHGLPVEHHVPGESALRQAGQVVDRLLLLGGHQERAQVAAVGGRGDQGGQEPGGYHEPAKKKVCVKKTPPNTPLTKTCVSFGFLLPELTVFFRSKVSLWYLRPQAPPLLVLLVMLSPIPVPKMNQAEPDQVDLMNFLP